MKQNYGVTSSSISMNCSDCWFHPALLSNKYLSLTCLPWLPTQAHGAWLSSSNRQLSRDGVRQPCWTSPWEPCCGKGAHLFEDARYSLVRPCVTLKLLHVEPIYKKKPCELRISVTCRGGECTSSFRNFFQTTDQTVQQGRTQVLITLSRPVSSTASVLSRRWFEWKQEATKAKSPTVLTL